ncbi:MAG: nucleoside phosphorylase [Lysobacterales bacterium]|jgi:nucleoside phosphorylase
MAHFQDLFGIPETEVRTTCILAPFLYKGVLQDLTVGKLHKGVRFSSASTDQFTFIHTNIGATQVGDCILHLKETDCTDVILYGACGSVLDDSSTTIGTIVTPNKAYSFESFSQLLTNDYFEPDCFLADKSLLVKFDTQQMSCASFGSLNLEQKYLKQLKDMSVNVVDMETSAFYAACQQTNLNGIALLYVTDFLSKANVFDRKSALDSSLIVEAQQTCIAHINNFLN